MNKGKLLMMLLKSKKAIIKKSPEITVALGVAGFIGTVVLSVKATPKATKLMEIEKKKKRLETGDTKAKLTVTETVKTTWKCYIPSALLGAFSIGCVLSSATISAKRNAAIMAAYEMARTTLKEYKTVAVEELGADKEKEIKEKVRQKVIDQNPTNASANAIVLGDDEVLCMDGFTGQYFKANTAIIDKAVNEFNRSLTYDMYGSLNEFYDHIPNMRSYKMGDELGWNLEDGLVEVSYGSAIAENGKPCLVMEYHHDPESKYQHN